MTNNPKKDLEDVKNVYEFGTTIIGTKTPKKLPRKENKKN